MSGEECLAGCAHVPCRGCFGYGEPTPHTLATRLAKAEADRDEARAAIARVRELHAPNAWDECPVCCTHEPDGQAYASAPSCPTYRAVDRPADPKGPPA
jgi:hypothetical protein